MQKYDRRAVMVSFCIEIEFFRVCELQGINWKHLAEKKVPAPFVPHIRDELDVSNFADEFTKMTPTDSPAVVPPNFDKIFKVCLHLFFS